MLLQEGHKWLNSVHRVNEDLKPAIMAWETVSALLSFFVAVIVCYFIILKFHIYECIYTFFKYSEGYYAF